MKVFNSKCIHILYVSVWHLKYREGKCKFGGPIRLKYLLYWNVFFYMKMAVCSANLPFFAIHLKNRQIFMIIFNGWKQWNGSRNTSSRCNQDKWMFLIVRLIKVHSEKKRNSTFPLENSFLFSDFLQEKRDFFVRTVILVPKTSFHRKVSEKFANFLSSKARCKSFR